MKTLRREGDGHQPDVYSDIAEVLWKYPIASAYRLLFRDLDDKASQNNTELKSILKQLVSIFNSNHDYSIYAERSESHLVKLQSSLSRVGHSSAYKDFRIRLESAATSATALRSAAYSIRYIPDHHPQSVVYDGKIQIAGRSLDAFSAQSDYFEATVALIEGSSPQLISLARQQFARGFILTNEEHQLVNSATSNGFEFTDLVTAILLHEQANKGFQTLQRYEYDPDLSEEINTDRSRCAIGEGYYLLGKVLATTATFTSILMRTALPWHDGDPIRALLLSAGMKATQRQVRAVRKVALAHCTHGLNSGELVARLASSVRTTFPRALIASLNVRSGTLHSGAIKKCMIQVHDYIESGDPALEYFRQSTATSNKYYGFGHRIHKTNEADPIEMLGKDPRVDLYLAATRHGFPEQSELIDRLLGYAAHIRSKRRSLGANTDFGAAVLFSAIGLSPDAAESFFCAFRCVGLCADIVNELRVKGNSRRPPFPETLAFW